MGHAAGTDGAVVCVCACVLYGGLLWKGLAGLTGWEVWGLQAVQMKTSNERKSQPVIIGGGPVHLSFF